MMEERVNLIAPDAIYKCSEDLVCTRVQESFLRHSYLYNWLLYWRGDASNSFYFSYTLRRGQLVVHIFLSAGAVEWQPWYFTAILLYHAPIQVVSGLCYLSFLKVTSVVWYKSRLDRLSLAVLVAYHIALHYDLLLR